MASATLPQPKTDPFGILLDYYFISNRNEKVRPNGCLKLSLSENIQPDFRPCAWHYSHPLRNLKSVNQLHEQTAKIREHQTGDVNLSQVLRQCFVSCAKEIDEIEEKHQHHQEQNGLIRNQVFLPVSQDLKSMDDIASRLAESCLEIQLFAEAPLSGTISSSLVRVGETLIGTAHLRFAKIVAKPGFSPWLMVAPVSGHFGILLSLTRSGVCQESFLAQTTGGKLQSLYDVFAAPSTLAVAEKHLKAQESWFDSNKREIERRLTTFTAVDEKFAPVMRNFMRENQSTDMVVSETLMVAADKTYKHSFYDTFKFEVPGDAFISMISEPPTAAGSDALPSYRFYQHHLKLALQRLSDVVFCSQKLKVLWQNFRFVGSTNSPSDPLKIVQLERKEEKLDAEETNQIKAIASSGKLFESLKLATIEILGEISGMLAARGLVYFPDTEDLSAPSCADVDAAVALAELDKTIEEELKKTRKAACGDCEQQDTKTLEALREKRRQYVLKTTMETTKTFDVIPEDERSKTRAVDVSAGVLDNKTQELAMDDCESLTRSTVLMVKCMMKVMADFETELKMESPLWNIGVFLSLYDISTHIGTCNKLDQIVRPKNPRTGEREPESPADQELRKLLLDRREEEYLIEHGIHVSNENQLRREFPDKFKEVDKYLVCHVFPCFIPKHTRTWYIEKGVFYLKQQRLTATGFVKGSFPKLGEFLKKKNKTLSAEGASALASLPTFVVECTDYSPSMQDESVFQKTIFDCMKERDERSEEFSRLFQKSFPFFEATKQRSAVAMCTHFNFYESVSVVYDIDRYKETGCGEMMWVDCNTNMREVLTSIAFGDPKDRDVCDLCWIPTSFAATKFQNWDFKAQEEVFIKQLFPARMLARVHETHTLAWYRANKGKKFEETWVFPERRTECEIVETATGNYKKCVKVKNQWKYKKTPMRQLRVMREVDWALIHKDVEQWLKEMKKYKMVLETQMLNREIRIVLLYFYESAEMV